MPKKRFFLKKRTKGTVIDVLDFMLTSDKCKYQCFNVQKVCIVLYIGCSDPVIGSSTATY